MTVKKLIGKLHLWLGLTSGLIVFIIAVTGCLYAFKDEIQDLTQPYRFTEQQDQAFLPPSRIQEIAENVLPGRHAHSVIYANNGHSAEVIFYEPEPLFYQSIFMNPYTGEVLKVKDMNAGFFRFILNGHFYLWLPPAIGQPVVASATLIFLVMVITGMILWWPKSRNGRKQRFTIRWSARWRRKNYDLHNVLGFYVTWVAIILAVTGLVWGFEWFRDAVYYTAGGEKSLIFEEPVSGPATPTVTDQTHAVDILWERMKAAYPAAETIEMHFPVDENSTILAAINPDASTYWQIDYIYFDQYTLQEVSADHIWDRFDSATVADQLMRMNYDIHVGAILGLPGKILAFFASLIVASLPVTGFMLWLGRRNKKGKAKSYASAIGTKPIRGRHRGVSTKEQKEKVYR